MAAELNEPRSWLHFGGEQRQLLFYALLGIVFVGLGAWLRRSRFPEFGPPAEKFGLLAVHLASFPLTIGDFYSAKPVQSGAWIACGLVTALALFGLVAGAYRHPEIPTRQWRLTWALLLGTLVALAWVGLAWHQVRRDDSLRGTLGPHWLAIPLLFGFCLVQAQVGLLSRTPFLLNLALTFIGLHLIAAYLQLFGTLFDTGLVFLVGGLLLIALAVFLERKRRQLLRRIPPREAPPAAAPTP